jgi:alpha-beta hydrolase superfamily lysophospholipase
VERHRAARPVRECAGQTGAAALALSGHSCPEDDISSVSNAHDIQRGAVNAHVDLVLLDNCYHMITIDRERRTVIAKLNEFIARIASSAAPARGANG